jgi:hypothetical protein
MSNKTKVAKPTLSPVQSKLTDEINKSNAKRGFTNGVVDMKKIKPKAKTRGNASGAWDMSANIVFTELMDIMYNYLPPQMQDFYNAIEHIASLNDGIANCQAVFDYWDSEYKQRQDLVTVMGTYGGMLLGTKDWDNASPMKNVTRLDVCRRYTGNDRGALIQLVPQAA